jgi:predicted dehydrogenase
MSHTLFSFGIMGAGNIVGKFCDAVNRIPNCVVAAVSSKSMERAQTCARQNHIPAAYDSYEEMLQKERLDAVYIATTPNYHCEQILLCLEHRIPVLCEKAMVLNRREAERVFGKARETNTFVMEAMWSRFLPTLNKAKEWMNRDEIGSLQFAQIAIGFAAPEDPQNRYYNFALGGGAAFDITVYGYEILTYLVDEPVRELHPQTIWAKTGVDKNCTVSVRFSHCLGLITVSLATSCLEEQAALIGTKGKIILPHCHYGQDAFLYDNEGRLKEHFTDNTPNGFVFEIEEVMRCVQTGKIESRIAPHQMTLDCASVFDQIYQDRNR